MLSDTLLALGLIVGAMAIPAMSSAFSKSEPPRVAAVAAVIGGALVVAAITMHPGGYRAQDIPAVVGRVLSQVFN